MPITKKEDIIIMFSQCEGEKANRTTNGISKMPVILLIKNITKIYWSAASCIPEIHPISFNVINFTEYIIPTHKIDSAIKI